MSSLEIVQLINANPKCTRRLLVAKLAPTPPAAPMVPFLVIAVALILGDIVHKPGQSQERRTLGLLVASFYVALVIANFAWLFPILTGIPISPATWDMEIWLPSWR